MIFGYEGHDLGRLASRWQQVVDEARREWLTLGTVSQFFEECPSDSLECPAHELPLHRGGIDCPAYFVGDEVAKNLDASGARIQLNLC